MSNILGPSELQAVWSDLAVLVYAQPEADRQRYLQALQSLVHDMRQNIGVVYGAEALLRRQVPATALNTELLDAIQSASRQTLALVTDFAHPFDSEINLPSQSAPLGPV